MDTLDRYINIIRSEYYCFKYNIRNYTITKNGLVDIHGDINLVGREMKKIPPIFNNVYGGFYCQRNKLTNLKGSPSYVSGRFNCSSNSLTSLKGSPDIIDGDIDFSFNNIYDLIGFNTKMSTIVNGYVSIGQNPISYVLGSTIRYDTLYVFKVVKPFNKNTLNLKRLNYGASLQGVRLGLLSQNHHTIREYYKTI